MISRACVRDVSYIGAHMRERDAHEILCQLPDDITPAHAALLCFDTAPEDCRFVCYDTNANPVAAFGWSVTHCPTLWTAWAFGTHGMKRAIPEMTEFIMGRQLAYMMKTHRPKRLEVRALADHDLAHRWLTMMGATKEASLPRFGKNGEDFTLYAWTDKTIWKAHERYRARGQRKKNELRVA
jgi:hypothetical protein